MTTPNQKKHVIVGSRMSNFYKVKLQSATSKNIQVKLSSLFSSQFPWHNSVCEKQGKVNSL